MKGSNWRASTGPAKNRFLNMAGLDQAGQVQFAGSDEVKLGGGIQVGYWIFVALVLAGMIIALTLPRYRLKKAIAAPFPDEWVAIVERNIGVYRNRRCRCGCSFGT